MAAGGGEPASSSDPFADQDPVDAALGGPASPAGPASDGPDDDFDALGFDTSFGTNPAGGFGLSPGGIGDRDPTPPDGIYAGEAVAVLNAHAVGKALAEANGQTGDDDAQPDLEALQQGLVGVDIGAATAVVARFDEDGHHVIVPNADDELLTPAQVVFDEDGEKLVGREARMTAPSAPGRAIIDLKEMIADPFFRLGGGDDVDARAVVAFLLGRLLDDVAADTGTRPTHVALAAPAWFAEPQREVLRAAAERAGVTLVGITDESLAAAVPYSLRLPDLNPRTALVFDLGHAALGVAVVRCAGGDIQILAQDARRDLGSSAWDRLLAEEASRKFKQAHGFDPAKDAPSKLDLRLRAEDAKRELSRRAQCALVVSGGGKSLKVGFTRTGFEEAAKGLVQRSLELARAVRDKAGLKAWREVDALILTGGGARTPLVRRALTAEVGREPEKGISHEEGVAIGALYWGIGERHRTAKRPR